MDEEESEEEGNDAENDNEDELPDVLELLLLLASVDEEWATEDGGAVDDEDSDKANGVRALGEHVKGPPSLRAVAAWPLLRSQYQPDGQEPHDAAQPSEPHGRTSPTRAAQVGAQPWRVKLYITARPGSDDTSGAMTDDCTAYALPEDSEWSVILKEVAVETLNGSASAISCGPNCSTGTHVCGCALDILVLAMKPAAHTDWVNSWLRSTCRVRLLLVPPTRVRTGDGSE